MNLAKHLFIWYRLCLSASGMLSAMESDRVMAAAAEAILMSFKLLEDEAVCFEFADQVNLLMHL